MFNLEKEVNIAIDGPVASGKTTVGKQLSERLGFDFLDTGLFYRAVTWAVLIGNSNLNLLEDPRVFVENMELDIKDSKVWAFGQDITHQLRSAAVEKEVSDISAIPEVRRVLVDTQRITAQNRRVVMVGRDIGTVVLPRANYKFFLEASVNVRVKRRHNEMKSDGIEQNVHELESEIVIRDSVDTNREDSPLSMAEDAILISTDDMTVSEVVDNMMLRISSG